MPFSIFLKYISFECFKILIDRRINKILRTRIYNYDYLERSPASLLTP